jgi:DNA modification methylase
MTAKNKSEKNSKNYILKTGDCVQEMAKLEKNSIDAIVCDPPYGLKFMGKEFDDLGEGAQQREWHRLWAIEALRVLKPGGHFLAFGGTRTYHHLATAVEEAGFEIRDQIQWLYGSGFPKSHNVGKAIDRKRHDREDVYKVTAWIREARDKAGIKNSEIDKAFGFAGMSGHWTSTKSQPAVPTLEQIPKLLEVLKLKEEEIPKDIHRLIYELNGKKGQPGENWFKREVVGKHDAPAKSIYSQGEGNLSQDIDLTAPATDEAAKWEGWGTALKPANEPIVVARKPFRGTVAENVQEHGTGALNIDGCRVGSQTRETWSAGSANYKVSNPEPWKETKHNVEGRWPANVILDEEAGALLDEQSGMKEGASRFFYCPKAGKKERNAGLEANNHPTVKPVALMAYLCRLITPPNGTVLDPFLGSGSTGIAAIQEGFNFVGIEKDPDYMKIAKARIEYWAKEDEK